MLFIVDAHSSMLFVQTDSATGKIYFMGSPKGQILENYSVFMDSKHLCNLKGRHYFVFNASVGKHILAMQKDGNKSNEIAVNVEGDKSYYIQFSLHSRIDTFRSTYTYIGEQIAEDLANMILPSLKQDVSCVEKTNNLNSNQY